MTKAKVIGLNKSRRRLQKILVGAISSTKGLKEIEKNVVSTFRSGKLLDGSSIKSLKRSTVEQRKRLARSNRTGKGYSASKSNLTLTGRFLESFKSSVELGRDKVLYIIRPTGVHKGYKNRDGSTGKGVSNQVIAESQKRMGRDITVVGKTKTRELKKIITKLIRQAIRKA